MMHHLLEKLLKDHQCLEPYFHQKNFGILNTLSELVLQIVTFLSNCISCNSYSLTIFQNYLVLTGFPLMRNNNFPLLTVSQMINHFCHFKHIFDSVLFLFGSSSDFKVFPQSMLRQLDLNFLNSLSLMLFF